MVFTMMTEMEHLDISGINGVPWDAVELPSDLWKISVGKKRDALISKSY